MKHSVAGRVNIFLLSDLIFLAIMTLELKIRNISSLH
jgi:hypothetical protein